MRKAIIGHGAEKFTPVTEAAAKKIIGLILNPGDTVVSGRSPMGGIDVWAEEHADAHEDVDKIIHAAEVDQWNPPGRVGYKARNLMIARDAQEAHVILVTEYPPDFDGMRFKACYHCKDRIPEHVKSGGCWTAWKAYTRSGAPPHWWIINPDGTFTRHDWINMVADQSPGVQPTERIMVKMKFKIVE